MTLQNRLAVAASALAAGVLVGLLVTPPSLAGATRNPETVDSARPSRMTLRWVAMGDSFTSGDGLPPYSDTICRRSDQSYPSLAALDLTDKYIVQLTNTACSGAKAADIASHAGPVDQLGVLDDSVDLVTLTLGGNDLGFSNLIIDCIASSHLPLLAPCRIQPDEIAGRTQLAVAPVGEALGLIHKLSPSAKVIVLGYPLLATRTPVSGSCGLFGDPELLRIQKLTLGLDSALASTVTGFGDQYISTLSEFSAHDSCAPDPWINPLTLNLGGEIMSVADEASFHPNLSGHRELARLITEALDH